MDYFYNKVDISKGKRFFMRRSWKWLGLLAFLTGVLFTAARPLLAEENGDGHVIFFDDEACFDCIQVKESGLLEELEAAGFTVTVFELNDREDRAEALRYARAYDIALAAPTIIVGEKTYTGRTAILDAHQAGDIALHAAEPLREPIDSDPLSFWMGLLLMVVGGLLDGINPCAIAMLLMFISIVGFTKKRSTLVFVGLSYIGAIFLTYFFIGLAFMGLLGFSRGAIPALSTYLYFGFMALCLFLFILSIYDFFVTRSQRYDKVKSQLPKFVQRFNQRVMERFAKALESRESNMGKVIALFFVPFIVGIVVGVTEAACTGPIYFGVLAMLEAQGTSTTLTLVEIFYILIFNIMFLVPLLIIMGIALKAKSVAGISNFVRRHISVIKIVTGIFFLLMAVYFLLLALDVDWIRFDYDFMSDFS